MHLTREEFEQAKSSGVALAVCNQCCLAQQGNPRFPSHVSSPFAPLGVSSMATISITAHFKLSIITLLVILCLFEVGCDGPVGNNADGLKSQRSKEGAEVEQKDDVEVDNSDTNAGVMGLSESKFIYIDSVPQGAIVFAMPVPEDKSVSLGFEEGEQIGITPFKVEASKYKDMRLKFVINVGDFIKKIEKKNLPELTGWITAVNESLNEISFPSPSRHFVIDSSYIIERKGFDHSLLSAIYSINWPVENRLCPVFLPRGISTSKLLPIVATQPAFEHKRTELSKLVSKSSIPISEQKLAVEYLVRCGKYVSIQRDQGSERQNRIIQFTVQRPGVSLLKISSLPAVVYPGENDFNVKGSPTELEPH